MRILAISDIHNNVACIRKLRSQESNQFDVVAIAGDIGGHRAAEIFAVLRTFKCPLVYVYGNWDSQLTYRKRFGKGCHLAHLNVVKIGAFSFTGFSEFSPGCDPILRWLPKTLTGPRHTQHYRDALVQLINDVGLDLQKTIVIIRSHSVVHSRCR
jgi:hypothetical protein